MGYNVTIKESIEDILKTFKGSRAMRQSYGSNIHLLIDRKIDDEFIAELTNNVVTALRADPRIKVTKVTPKLANNKLSVKVDTENESYEVKL